MLDMADGRKRNSADSGKRTIYPKKGSRRISPLEFANSKAKHLGKKVTQKPGKEYRLPKVNTADKSSLDTLGFSNRKPSPSSRSKMLDMSGGRAASEPGKTQTLYSKIKSRQISPRKFFNTKFRRINHRNLKVSKKHYKMLRNGTVDNGTITKRKERVIYKQQNNKLRKIKPKKIDKSCLKPLKSFNKQQNFSKYRKLTSSAKGAAKVAAKPAEILKKSFTAQAEKSDDNGVKAAKAGVQICDYGTRAIKTAVNTGAKTAKKGTKLAKQVHRKVHKSTSADLRRRLRKRVNHSIAAEAKNLAKHTMKKGATDAGKTTAKATAKAAKATAKAFQVAAKATVSAISKAVSFIVSTAPWSFILIGGILMLILIAMMATSLFSNAGGTIDGGAAWVMGDEEHPTSDPEDIYRNYKGYVEDINSIIENDVIQTLKTSVTGFCSDNPTPSKIITYKSKNNTSRLYPAYHKDSTVNGYIDKFKVEDEDYIEMLSALFVLMTREKQKAEDVGENEIFEFIFKTEDISEFIGQVNTNTSRWGDTFFIKTDKNKSPVSCPGQNCKRKSRPGCKCAYSTNEDGHIRYYCKGHPYCPINHTEKEVSL